MIGRLFKSLVLLLVLGAIGIAGYAYLGKLAPDASSESLTVTLDAD